MFFQPFQVFQVPPLVSYSCSYQIEKTLMLDCCSGKRHLPNCMKVNAVGKKLKVVQLSTSRPEGCWPRQQSDRTPMECARQTSSTILCAPSLLCNWSEMQLQNNIFLTFEKFASFSAVFRYLSIRLKCWCLTIKPKTGQHPLTSKQLTSFKSLL